MALWSGPQLSSPFPNMDPRSLCLGGGAAKATRKRSRTDECRRIDSLADRVSHKHLSMPFGMQLADQFSLVDGREDDALDEGEYVR